MFVGFRKQVETGRQATGLTDISEFNTQSELDNATDYWINTTGQSLDKEDSQGARDTGGGAGLLDLFRGTVDNILAPYIAELSVEGFKVDFKKWQQVFGAREAQVMYCLSGHSCLGDNNPTVNKPSI